MGFQADVRAASVTTLKAHASAQSVKLQTNPGRPRTLAAPSAFVDVMRETIVYLGPISKQRTVQADVVLIWGSFDANDVVAQKDAFVDGYIEYVATSGIHAAGANTTLAVVATEDDPTFVPDWVPLSEQRTYFATRMTLEGFAGE